MVEINDIDFEEDQQNIIEKTDIQTLASYCQELQQVEDHIALLEKEVKTQKEKSGEGSWFWSRRNIR